MRGYLRHRDAREDTDANRDAVAAVDEVDRVRHRVDPQHRHTEPQEPEVDVRPPGQPDVVDAVAGHVCGAAARDKHERSKHRTGEFDVVEEADDEHERRGGKQAEETARFRRKELAGVRSRGRTR